MDAQASARARGRMGGRKRKLSGARAQHLVGDYLAQEMTIQEMAEEYGISRDAVYDLPRHT